MTDRKTLDQMNSDDLDALYYRLDQARAAAALHRQGLLRTAELYAAIEAAPVSGPAATEPTVDRQTALVLSALHRSAEADVSRVIDLYERWVKAGPPPLGASLSRWWDERLIELHDAILNPTKEQP
jgi:hypothetical protein